MAAQPQPAHALVIATDPAGPAPCFQRGAVTGARVPRPDSGAIGHHPCPRPLVSASRRRQMQTSCFSSDTLSAPT